MIHKGFCVIAGSPIDEHTPFNEIFLARIPYEKILETKSYGMSDKSDFEEIATEFTQAVDEVILDIIKVREILVAPIRIT